MIDEDDLTPEEAKAIAALRPLAKTWPDTLWLFSGGGTLSVMRCAEDGSHAVGDDGGTDPDYEVCDIDIDNDGGGW